MTTLEPGLTGTAARTVTTELTAIALGSGDVAVFGTPALLALIEQAAVNAVAAALPEGKTSVGSTVALTHLAPSRVGAHVHATARLMRVDGRKLFFECEAHQGETLIGRATHARAVVERARFD